MCSLTPMALPCSPTLASQRRIWMRLSRRAASWERLSTSRLRFWNANASTASHATGGVLASFCMKWSLACRLSIAQIGRCFSQTFASRSSNSTSITIRCHGTYLRACWSKTRSRGWLIRSRSWGTHFSRKLTGRVWWSAAARHLTNLRCRGRSIWAILKRNKQTSHFAPRRTTQANFQLLNSRLHIKSKTGRISLLQTSLTLTSLATIFTLLNRQQQMRWQCL